MSEDCNSILSYINIQDYASIRFFVEDNRLRIAYDSKEIIYPKELYEYFDICHKLDSLDKKIQAMALEQKRKYNVNGSMTMYSAFYAELTHLLEKEIKCICLDMQSTYKRSSFKKSYVYSEASHVRKILEILEEYVVSCCEKVSDKVSHDVKIRVAAANAKTGAESRIRAGYAGQGMLSSDITAIILYKYLVDSDIEKKSQREFNRIDRECDAMIGISREQYEMELVKEVANTVVNMSGTITHAVLTDIMDDISEEDFDYGSISCWHRMKPGEKFGITESMVAIRDLIKENTNESLITALVACPYSDELYVKIIEKNIMLPETALCSDHFKKSGAVFPLLEDRIKKFYSDKIIFNNYALALSILNNRDAEIIKNEIDQKYNRFLENKAQLEEEIKSKNDELQHLKFFDYKKKQTVSEEIMKLQETLNSMTDF